MSKAYLYTFSMPANTTRKAIATFLSESDKVDDWFYSIPSSIFIVTPLTAKALSDLIVSKFGKHRHFVTRVSEANRAGYMPTRHWERFPRDDAKS